GAAFPGSFPDMAATAPDIVLFLRPYRRPATGIRPDPGDEFPERSEGIDPAAVERDDIGAEHRDVERKIDCRHVFPRNDHFIGQAHLLDRLARRAAARIIIFDHPDIRPIGNFEPRLDDAIGIVDLLKSIEEIFRHRAYRLENLPADGESISLETKGLERTVLRQGLVGMRE